MPRTMLALLVLCVPALARDNGYYNRVSNRQLQHRPRRSAQRIEILTITAVARTASRRPPRRKQRRRRVRSSVRTR